MSYQEIESYLALVGRRLSVRQREDVAAELRDHLEERLAELVAEGVPNEEAARQALEEFGEAAGLAGAFLSVSQTRRKRWLMKWTTVSIGGLAAAAILAVALWPEGANVKLTPQAVAQAPTPVKAELSKSQDDIHAAIEAALAKQVDANFEQSPLVEIIDYLRESTGQEFYLDRKALEGVGVNKESPVTLQLTKVRISTLLDLALGQLDLTYIERGGIIVITTPEVADNALEVRVYNCRDLLKFALSGVRRPQDDHTGGAGGATLPAPTSGLGSAGPSSASMLGVQPAGGGSALPGSRLIGVLQSTVAPTTWQESGGAGSISEFNGLVVIRQTSRVHQETEQVLAMLRKAVADDLAANKAALEKMAH